MRHSISENCIDDSEIITLRSGFTIDSPPQHGVDLLYNSVRFLFKEAIWENPVGGSHMDKSGEIHRRSIPRPKRDQGSRPTAKSIGHRSLIA